MPTKHKHITIKGEHEVGDKMQYYYINIDAIDVFSDYAA